MTQNYWAPLASQVEELDNTPSDDDIIIHEENKQISWKLSKHTLSDVKRWSSIMLKRKAKKLDRIKREETVLQIADHVNEQDTAVFDSGATSHCGRENDNFIPTNETSHKVFHLPTGQTTHASVEAKLHHDVREPARTVDIVPDLQHNSLLSASKFADANYVTILTPKEVLIYDGKDLTITVSSEAILRGWREVNGLWRVPLQNGVAPRKSQYLLLTKESEEAIANVYELPSTENNCAIPTCLCRISEKAHMAQGHPSRQLRYMAALICRGGSKAFPRVR